MKKLIVLLMVVCIAVLLSGCSGFKLPKDGSTGVDVYGFGKDFTSSVEYFAPVRDTVTGIMPKRGALKSRKVSSNSRFKDYLMGLNVLFDTGMEFYNKAKPL